jgi:hypothetical protein
MSVPRESDEPFWGQHDLTVLLRQFGQRLDQHRQETKDGLAAVHRFIGGVSTTLADPEERIKELEGE